jgi:hypothetical protein
LRSGDFTRGGYASAGVTAPGGDVRGTPVITNDDVPMYPTIYIIIYRFGSMTMIAERAEVREKRVKIKLPRDVNNLNTHH